MLNPIEYAFSKIKNHVKQLLSANSIDNIHDGIADGIAQLTASDL